MDIPCKRPDYVHGDNQNVLCNTSISESTLKKKNQMIACHLVREGTARDECRTSCVNTHVNEVKLLTKILPPGEKRKGFDRRSIHYPYGDRNVCCVR